MRKTKTCTLTSALIRQYAAHLQEQERAGATIQKYLHDLTALLDFLGGAPLTKAALIEWKTRLIEAHAPATVNSMLAAVNGFLSFMGWRELAVKLLKIQRSPFTDERRELTREEYARLVRAAEREGNQRLSLMIQTICATGIRVSELKFITVEAVKTGRTEIVNKGKRRPVFLPEKLRRLLKTYLQKQKITAGAVFVTRTGKPVDRSNIWRDMKRLCESAGVEPDTGGLCPHHQEHSYEVCGYIEAVEGHPCGHVHDGSCGYVEAAEEVPCDKDCAYTPAVAGAPCQHEHDELCGYVAAVEGQPCGYVCHICPVQAMIDALPDAEGITLDNRADVEAQLAAIDEARAELTDEEIAALDITRYAAAVSALAALDGQTGADVPVPATTKSNVSYLDTDGST